MKNTKFIKDDNYLNNLIKKNNYEQLLHIIIIKLNNTSITKIISNYDDLRLKITIISKYNDIISHHNIKKIYINNNNNYLDILTNLLDNNNSKYYMILYDNYHLENNFFSKILDYLNNVQDLDMLILYQDILNKNEYFNITLDFFKKNYNNNLCIINNNIKKEYKYSISEIGLFLYHYSIIINYKNIIGSTYYKFTVINNNIEYIKDIILLFDIYFSNIETTLLQNTNININNYYNDIINEPLIELN